MGTNTAIRLESDRPWDPIWLSPASLRAYLDGEPVTGTLDIDVSALRFIPRTPLPAGQRVDVEISEHLRDELGRSIAVVAGDWAFTTGEAPIAAPGFTFAAPQTPPSGGHAPDHALTMDGDTAVLSWASMNGLVVTTTDGAGFLPPQTLADTWADQIDVAAANGRIHVVWTYFPPDDWGFVIYNQADLALASPPPDATAFVAASYDPHVATGEEGDVAIVWTLIPDAWDPPGSLIVTSTDGGDSWASIGLIDDFAWCARVAWVGDQVVTTWLDSSYPIMGLHVAISRDHGFSLDPPVTLAGAAGFPECPQLVANHLGEVLVLWSEGLNWDDRSLKLVSFSPTTGTVGSRVQLYAPGEAPACARLAASTVGKVVLVEGRGEALFPGWTRELRTSDDGGHSFGPLTALDIITETQGCPDVGYAPSGDLFLAWHQESYQLQVSRGRPRKPCE